MLNLIVFFSESNTWEDQSLERYNQLKDFYNKNGYTKVTYSNCADKSLVNWANWQRR